MRLVNSRVIVAFIAGLLSLTCGDETQNGPQEGRVTVAILSATPQAAFAPAQVDFTGEVQTVPDVDLPRLRMEWDFGDGTTTTGSLEVTHRYTQTGTFNVQFTASELSETGSVIDQDTDSIEVVIYPAADLRVSVPFVSDLVLRSQDNLRVSFDLFNDASEVPIPFQVGVFLAQNNLINHITPPDTDTLESLIDSRSVYRIASRSFDRLDGDGFNTNVDLSEIRIPDAVPTATYELFVHADDTGVVGELDEINNVQFAVHTIDFINTSTQGPDLVVSNLCARPSRTNSLSAVTVDIELANQGTEPARDFEYAVYLSYANTYLEDTDTFLGTGTIDNLPDGQDVDLDGQLFSFEEPIAVIGNYFVLVEVDSTDAVIESNEENNLGSSGAIVVTDQPIPGTDLVPIEFTFSPQTSFLDGSLFLDASVVNQGVEDAPSQFFCRVYLSSDDDLDPVEDPLLDSINFPLLGAGEVNRQERITRIPGFFSPGLFYLFLSCDPNGQIPEADEDNNTLMAEDRLRISTDPEVDLRFGSFDLSPTTVENGQEVEITMEVCNDGTNGVGPSVARVIASLDPQIDLADTVLIELTLDPIDANDCLLIEESVTAICDTFQSHYQVFAQLDVTDLLPETDESNNTVDLDTPLIIEGIYCVCEIDPLEGNNNSPATPTFVSAREYTDLTMCDVAVDWYAIPLVQGDTLRAFITFENHRGNLDLTLYASDRATILDRSTSDGDREEVLAFVVSETGDYLLKVFGRTASDRNVYDMTIEVTPPQHGTDLIVSDISLSNTTPVLGQEVDLTFAVYNLGDVAAGSSTTRAYLSEDIDIDPADDLLLTQVVLSDVPAIGVRRRTVPVDMPINAEGGNRYIGVVADALNQVPGELDETNNLGLSDLFYLDAGCYDPLEPNNSIDDPYPLALTGEITSVVDLLVCTDNKDFYEICGQQGEYLVMTVQFDPTAGDIDLYLYDESLTRIARSEGSGGEERVEVDYLTTDACYILEVLVLGRNREVPYTLTVENGVAPEELRCSSAGEPNQSFDSAAPLGQHLDGDLAICPVSDIDFYIVRLSRGASPQFSLVPAAGQSAVPQDLRMSLWGPQRNFLANTISATETLAYEVTAGGNHYLRVSSLVEGPRNQPYRLQVEGLDGIDLEPLDFSITPQIASPGDRVQYTFTLQNNRTLSTQGAFSCGIYLSEDPILSPAQDILLQALEEPELAGNSSRSVGGKVTLPLWITEGVLHYLGVFVDDLGTVSEFVESNNIAILPLQIEPRCLPDTAEPNELRIDAADLTAFVGVDLTLCPGDLDWFFLDGLEEGDQVTIEATFSYADGDLDLFVYDADGLPLASGESIGDDELVCFEVPPSGGLVFLEAAPFGTTRLTYQLALTVE
ncbi:MAG: PKD domain-containing protein [Bradymonadales bacterium]|nr:PKD domain-containing protein [Bradymonadales bacterium]